MSRPFTPRQILTTLLPYLKTAGAYAQQIQAQIQAQPDKADKGDNFFASALSDADLSIQTMMEVVLLGLFPQVRFFGEEYEQTYNTKYFRAIDLGEPGDYLITLDPIFSGLAWSFIFGLFASTAFSLLVIPVIF